MYHRVLIFFIPGNIVASYYCSSYEIKIGIILASIPGGRQFFTSYGRTRTIKPAGYRQYFDQDSQRAYARISLRDIFWYRQPSALSDGGFEARQTFQTQDQSRSTLPQSHKEVQHPALDHWRARFHSSAQLGSHLVSIQHKSFSIQAYIIVGNSVIIAK